MAGSHFSCSLTAVTLARVHAYGGAPAVAELLREARSTRTPEYLLDISNWISFDEAVALWAAGARVTHHPQFARAVGEDAARRLNGSPVAALFRSLGSPEEVYRQLATGSTKFSVVTTLEAVDVGPGYAEIVATAVDGFRRNADHCAWTCGLLTQPTVLFGFAPAIVEHEQCAALGADVCRYRVIWDADGATASAAQSSEQLEALQLRLDAMSERLDSMFATASDLIGADDLADVLARITDRAALEVRAPRYLLAVRTRPGGEPHIHAKGFASDEVAATAERLLDGGELPESWLVVPVRSTRRDYGRLLATYEGGHAFFAHERELLEVYARYAATALDNAAALMEARKLHDLARALAAAGTSGEVAAQLVDAVPIAVDCDRVGVYLWDESRGEIVRRALNGGDESEWSIAPSPGGPLEKLLHDPSPEPLFVSDDEGNPLLRDLLANTGAVASIVVPITAPDTFLGLLIVSVMSHPERLEPTPDLLDRLSGVAAHATTALQNGRLLDRITHQALHDELTGLANRAQFTTELRGAIRREHPVTLLYIDLDNFKPVNDRLGHEIGDRLLMAVADRLNGCTRAADTVARLGGDEFAVLIAEGDAGGVAERLAAAFDDPFAIDGHELAIGASVGRAVSPGDAEDLLRRADAAMFAVKRERQRTRRAPATRL